MQVRIDFSSVLCDTVIKEFIMITTSEDIGYRVKWINGLFYFYSIMFGAVSAWLFYSMSQTRSPDSLLVAMAIVTCLAAVIFLATAIAGTAKKRACLKICGETLIVAKYKEKIIDFADIENVQYTLSRIGAPTNSIFANMTLKSGKITITLKDKSKIYVRNVKNVKTVCYTIYERIFGE